MIKQLFISGSTGYIGKELVKQLKEKEYLIKCLVRNKLSADTGNINFIKHSLEDGFPEVEIFDNTALIHLAWNNVKETNNEDHLSKELDIQFRFLQEAVLNGVNTLIVAGSCYEYGLVYGPIDVNHPTRPTTKYGMAKKLLYERLKNFQSEKKFKLLWLRIFYIYGNDDLSGNLVSQFDKAISNGDKTFAMSLGEQLLDFSHISDVAKKIIKLTNFEDGIYNICSGSPISVRRLIEKRKEEKKSNIKLDLGKFTYRNDESIAFWGIPNV